MKKQNGDLLDLACLLNSKLHIFRPEVTVGGNFRLRIMALIKAFGDGKIESMHKAKLSFSQSALRNGSYFLGLCEREGDAQGEQCQIYCLRCRDSQPVQ